MSDLFTIGRWTSRDWPQFNEGMRIDGNCRHFLVEGNTMTRAFQIAFDVLGWSPGEAKRLLGSGAPNPGQPKWIVYRGNTVRDTQRASTKLQANPMYVDRAAGPILFEDNYTDDTIGMFVSTEPYGYPGYEEPTLPHSDFIIRNNLMTHRGYGLMLGQCDNGGYGTYRPTNGNCPVYRWPVPDGTGKRWMYKFTVVHNTIINNSGSYPNLLYSYIRDVWVKNNVMVNNISGMLTQAVWPKPCGDVSVCGPAEVDNWHSNGNLFYASGTPTFMWGGRNRYSGFNNYQSSSGQDAGGVYASPSFVNPSGGDYRLAPGSPGYNDALPITTATNAGNGSTELKVANARHFCDGWGVPGQGGDRIVIGGKAYTIKAVDWGANLIQLDAPAKWSIGEGVSYYYESGRKSRGIGPSVSTKGSSPIPPIDPGPGLPVLPDLPDFTSVQATSQSDLGYLDTSYIDTGVLLAGDMFPDQYDSRAWIRFNNVEIVHGQEIEEAYLLVWPWVGNGGPYDLMINGEATDDSAPYQGTRQDWDDRVLTTARVSWRPPTSAVKKWILSPSIKAVLNEIINRPGWKSGNSISLQVSDAEAGYQMQRRFQMADVQSGHGPRLLFKTSEITGGITPSNAYPTIELGSRNGTRHGLSTVIG